MLDFVDEPAIRSRIHPITVDDYHRLGETGVLGERVELLRGIIIDQEKKCPLHCATVDRLRRYLMDRLPAGFLTRSEHPLTLVDSEPEPDIAVVRGAIRDYIREHPRTAEMAVEVCVTTEDLDRLKLGIYAEAGIPECRLLFPKSQAVERHTEPANCAYGKVERIDRFTPLASTVFENLVIPLPEFLLHRTT